MALTILNVARMIAGQGAMAEPPPVPPATQVEPPAAPAKTPTVGPEPQSRPIVNVNVSLGGGKGAIRTGGVGTGEGLNRFAWQIAADAGYRLQLREKLCLDVAGKLGFGTSTAVGEDLQDIENTAIYTFELGALVALVYQSSENFGVSLGSGFVLPVRWTAEGKGNDGGSLVPLEMNASDISNDDSNLNFQIPVILALRFGAFTLAPFINIRRERFTQTSGPAKAHFEMPPVDGGLIFGVDIGKLIWGNY